MDETEEKLMGDEVEVANKIYGVQWETERQQGFEIMIGYFIFMLFIIVLFAYCCSNVFLSIISLVS